VINTLNKHNLLLMSVLLLRLDKIIGSDWFL
jgi:hypothetical protein